MTFTIKEFIFKSKKTHGNKYDYSLSKYITSKIKIEIVCTKHGSFWQSPNDHWKGRGCPSCAKERVSEKLSSSTEEFIKSADIVHINKYDYSLSIYNGSNIKLIIICPLHGNFDQSPDNHLQGEGCPICANLSRSKNLIKSFEEFIIQANTTHNYKYDYSMVNYIGSFIKIEIICPIHGSFTQTPSNHLQGQGCRYCSIDNRTKTLSEFIKEATQVHNGKYNYQHVIYINTLVKIQIECGLHGIFNQTPDAHLQGQGCPKCTSSVSKSEILWLDILGIPQHYRHKTLKINEKNFYVDAYDPSTNTIYEFYGDYWHGNPVIHNPKELNSLCKKTFDFLYQKTIERENTLKNAGYKIISIWENEFKKFNTKIK